MNELLVLIICGSGGAIVKDILVDNCLILPSIKDGKIMLGFVGGTIIGACVGVLVDNDPVTAFLSGYAGYQILEGLISKNGK